MQEPYGNLRQLLNHGLSVIKISLTGMVLTRFNLQFE